MVPEPFPNGTLVRSLSTHLKAIWCMFDTNMYHLLKVFLTLLSLYPPQPCLPHLPYLPSHTIPQQHFGSWETILPPPSLANSHHTHAYTGVLISRVELNLLLARLLFV